MKGRRAAPLLLIAGGVLVAGFAITADALGVGGAPGIGPRQAILIALGAAAAITGSVLTPKGRPMREWIAARWQRCPPLTAAQCIVVGAWIGIATGVVEVIHSAILKYGFGRLLKQPEHLVWMAPLCYLVLFGSLGLVLAMIRSAWSRVVTMPLVVFALMLAAVWSQLLMHPQIAGWAVGAVCLGVAVQSSRTASRRAATLPRAMRRSLGWLATLVVVAGVTVTVKRALPRYDVANLPATTANPPPNVLLVVLDTVRADHVGLGGHDKPTTPNIDELARNAVIFDWAISTAPWTLPSHASMFTGRYHHQMNADWVVPLNDAHPTLAEVLSANGYATAGFVGNLMYCLREHGLARGFARYEDIQVNTGTLVLSTSIGRLAASYVLGAEIRDLATNDAETVTDRFLDWLPADTDVPFFAFLNYIDAHALYLAPERFHGVFGAPGPHIAQWYDRTDWSEGEMQQFRDAYDSCIAYVDEQLARVVAELRQRDLLDNTVIIITSDHGEHFGEHGLTDHGNSLYRELLHVPLVVRLPGRTESLRVEDFVSLRDLGVTILELAGVEAPRLPGQSLARFWSNETEDHGNGEALLLSEVSRGINTPDHEPRSKGDMKSLFHGGMHYIRNGDHNDELYDLRADPREQENLIDEPSGQAAKPLFEKMLERIPGG